MYYYDCVKIYVKKIIELKVKVETCIRDSGNNYQLNVAMIIEFGNVLVFGFIVFNFSHSAKYVVVYMATLVKYSI